jgi:hypothetical protein
MNPIPWTLPFRSWRALLAVSVLSSSLPALALEPQEMLHLAKKNMQDRTWKVEVQVVGEHSMKVAGLIHDNDFDLTVKTQTGESRQIVIGQKCWMSMDRGKTWQAKPGPDRRFYYLTHAPINYRADEKIPPFEKLDRDGDKIPGTTHIRLINEAPVTYEGDRANLWIKVREDGTPDVLLRSFGPLVFANDYVTANVHYSAADEEKIIAPPGNPAAVPAVNPADEMLLAALQRMEQGLWEVDCKAEFKKKARARGLLGWEDFDLNMDPKDGNDGPVHGIRMKGVVYGSLNEGKTWKIETENDVAIYNWVHSPLISKVSMPPFEEVSREDHEGETWVKLRLKVEENITNRDELPTYWIALAKDGKAAGVRRYLGFGIRADDPQNPIKYDIAYRPAAADATISAPRRELIVNAKEEGVTSDLAKKSATKANGGPPLASPKASGSVSSKTINLIGGAKLKLEMPTTFELDKKNKSDKQTIATFTRKDGVWGSVSRGTHGLKPDELDTYMEKRMKEYSQQLGKDLGTDLFWIKHEIVKLGEREWVDLRFVPMLKDAKPPQSLKDVANHPLYTRFLATSYKGQLLEITFTSNLDTTPETKVVLDQILDSVKFEE